MCSPPEHCTAIAVVAVGCGTEAADECCEARQAQPLTCRWHLGAAPKREDLGRRPLLPAPFDPQRARDDNLQLSVTICARICYSLCERRQGYQS